jgi:hypothetical protein
MGLLDGLFESIHGLYIAAVGSKKRDLASIFPEN